MVGNKESGDPLSSTASVPSVPGIGTWTKCPSGKTGESLKARAIGREQLENYLSCSKYRACCAVRSAKKALSCLKGGQAAYLQQHIKLFEGGKSGLCLLMCCKNRNF
jgi:hypothetical protein